MAAKAGADHYRAMQRAAIEARKASGAWFTAKGAERHRESARASGAKAGATTLERHGREHFQRIGKAAGAAKAAESIWVLCVLCANPERPLYRTKYDQQARPQPYHHDCYKEWRRTDAQRERSRKLGALGQIRQRVKAHGDAGLLAEVDAKIAAELRRLRDPSQAGRPAKLLDNKSLAIGMARMQHEGKMSAAEVAKVYGMATAPIDGTGEPEPTGNAYRLLRLGRALLGYDRLPGGPRRKAA